jgi:C4-type Zn-finger protein
MIESNFIICETPCPYCGRVALKALPEDYNFEKMVEDAYFCSECGRHAINFRLDSLVA